jgi:hypothetical protein
VAAQHGEETLPRRGRLQEAEHGLADEVGESEARLGPPREEEEGVAAADLGEVGNVLPRAIGELEAPHETAQADLDLAVQQGLHGAPRIALGRDHRDREPLLREVAQRHAGGQRRVEGGMERHGNRQAAHGMAGSITIREPAGVVP